MDFVIVDVKKNLFDTNVAIEMDIDFMHYNLISF